VIGFVFLGWLDKFGAGWCWIWNCFLDCDFDTGTENVIVYIVNGNAVDLIDVVGLVLEVSSRVSRKKSRSACPKT
jgi:hypothetical protein